MRLPFTRPASPTLRERITGSMFGTAYGDSMGAVTEFMSYSKIVETFGWKGPKTPRSGFKVTDDTQMALCVSRAVNSGLYLDEILTDEFVDWSYSMGTHRAPGRACMTACARLGRGLPWWEATNYDSKGCGANMRVAPVGLKAGLTVDEMAGMAQLQAAMTHAHPTALAAAELTAYAVRLLVEGTPLVSLPRLLLTRCDEQRWNYRDGSLGELWAWCGYDSPESYISTGWDECEAALWDLTNALRHPRPKADPCIATGGGWVAEECLATALHCALLFPGDPVMAIRRAATTSGDSDSIAAITGALVGAAHGFNAWPREWGIRIEYRTELVQESAALSVDSLAELATV